MPATFPDTITTNWRLKWSQNAHYEYRKQQSTVVRQLNPKVYMPTLTFMRFSSNQFLPRC